MRKRQSYIKEKTKIMRKAYWINDGKSVLDFTRSAGNPALYLRKTFTVNTACGAEITCCGLGFYELYLNGKRLNDGVLCPPFSNYDKRVYFNKYKARLKRGVNTLCAIVGDGWYNHTVSDAWQFYNATWTDCAKFYLTLQAGDSSVVSDRSWKVSSCGAITFNAFRSGEVYDARKENDFLSETFDDGDWQNARIARPPAGKFIRQNIPPVRECGTYLPQKIIKSENGWIYDFGRNLAGWCELTFSAKAGEKAVIKYGENVSGNKLDQSNIARFVKNAASQTDEYIFKGAGEEKYKPRFNYHGFRYAEVSGIDTEGKNCLKAISVHTDVEKTGDFKCSDETLNWFYDCAVSSTLSNMHGVLEDCPHRERNGWTGDLNLSCAQMLYNFDCADFLRKWLYDLTDCQRENGQLSGVAPVSGWGYNVYSGPTWDFALFKATGLLHEFCGDAKTLKRIYPHIKKYMSFIDGMAEDFLVSFGLPDWCVPEDIAGDKESANANLEFTDSCCYMQMALSAARFADILNKQADAKKYFSLAQNIKQAVCAKYVRGENVADNSQTALSAALRYNLVSGKDAEKVLHKLIKNIEADGYAFHVGVNGLEHLWSALSSFGRADIFYKMMKREEYPSFKYWKKLGATTLWEGWEERWSKNHHFFSHVVEWLFNYVAGIKNDGIAFDKVTVAPALCGFLDFAKAEVLSPRGKIRVEWTCENGEFSLTLCLPAGTCARIVLPNGEEFYENKQGEHEFICKFNQGGAKL